MRVWYKFRSSVGFEAAELPGDGGGVPVRELRAEVMRRKGLPLTPDFDLVVSDAKTGEVYEDDECEILDGSSVIIKRVPSGRPIHSDLDGKRAGAAEALASSPSENVDMEKFDDFGVDCYPGLEALPPESDTYVGNVDSTAHKKVDVVPRCSEASFSRCQNFEGSNISEAMSKGNLKEICDEKGGIYVNKQPMSKSKSEEQKKLDEGRDLSSPKMLNMELPTELRCSLCNMIFKEAVLIPCCQHSFCNRCIRSALVERARCPKCTSTKCTVEDLLPNLSLRQAIEHFLEAQVATNGVDNIIPNVPDGESGIQAKEVSCAMSIHQKEPQLPHSPSATGKGSNQVTPETAYDDRRTAGIGSRIIRLDAVKSGKSAPSSLKVKQMQGDENRSAVASKQTGGSTSSKVPQNLLQKDEAKKKVYGVHPQDGNGVSMPLNKYRKGDRNCFMCGSPHHLIRDCPAASNSYTMQMGDAALPGGVPAYGQPYWQGSSFPHFRPYGNAYGAPGVMPFDPTFYPVGPFGIPSYLPSFYASMQMPHGFMRLGGVSPAMMTGAGHPLTHAEFMDLQDGEQRQRHLSEPTEREPDYDSISEDHHYRGAQRKSCEPKRQLDMETTRSYSDNDSQRIHKNSDDKYFYSSSHQRPGFTSDEEFHSVDRKHEKGSRLSVSGRDLRTHHSDRTTSEVQDFSDSSNYCSRERKTRHRHISCSKKHNERKGRSASDSSQRGHHQSRRDMSDDGEKVVTGYRRHSSRHRNQSDSGLEPDSSSDRREFRKEKGSGHSSRHSRHKLETADELLEDDRWEMVDGLDDEYRGEYRYHKRKRTH